MMLAMIAACLCTCLFACRLLACLPASTGGANDVYNSNKTVRRSYGKLTVRDPSSANSDVTQFIAHMYLLVVPGTTKRSGTVRIYHVTCKEKPLPQRSVAAAEMNAKTARLQVLFDNLSHPNISASLKQLLEAQITRLLKDEVSHVDKQGSGEDGGGIHDAQEGANCQGQAEKDGDGSTGDSISSGISRQWQASRTKPSSIARQPHQVATMSWEQARILLNSPNHVGDGERPCRLADKYSTAEEMVGLVLNDLVGKRPIEQDGGRTDSWSAKGKSCTASPVQRP